VTNPIVVPAQAGTHACRNLEHGRMDPGFRRDDEEIAITGDASARSPEKKRPRFLTTLVPYLEALPASAVFLVFFAAPMVLVVVVSFFGYETYKLLIPDFTFENYREVFSEAVTYRTYLITLKFCAIVWAITLVLGFFIAYFIAFQVQSRTWQMALLLLCSIPFWTSIVIRMIAWIPLLGRNGIVNRVLVGTHLADMPQEWLLYSEFAVILGYVYRCT